MAFSDDSLGTPAKSPGSLIPEGSIKISLVALPFWYQLVAIVLSALIPFFLNDFSLLSWASHNLHFDFGTSTLWTSSRGSSIYFDMVNTMSIRERLGFAVYASLVLGVVWTVSRMIYPASIRCAAASTTGRTKSSSSANKSSLSKSDLPDGKGDSTEMTPRFVHQYLVFPKYSALEKLLFGLHFLEALLVIKHHITDCVESSHFEMITSGNDSATSVVQSHVKIEEYPESSRIVLRAVNLELNTHVIVQLDIVLRILSWWFSRVVVPSLVVLVYRLVRDSHARRVHSLRWYSLTLAVVRGMYVLVPVLAGMRMYQEYERAVEEFIWGEERFATLWKSPMVWSELIQLLRGCSLWAAVNYIYGPSLRSSYSITASTRKDHFISSAKVVLRCVFLPLIASLMVLGVAVGVHIVELILLWLFTFLLLIWVPVALDSGSLELMSFFSAVATFVNEFAPVSSGTTTLQPPNPLGDRHKFFVNADAVMVFAASFSLLLAVSMLHNVGCSMFGSRMTSIGVFLMTITAVGGSCLYLLPLMDVGSMPTLNEFVVSWLPDTLAKIVSSVWQAGGSDHDATDGWWNYLNRTSPSSLPYIWVQSGLAVAVTLLCVFVNTHCEKRWIQQRQDRQPPSPSRWSGDSKSRGSRCSKHITVCSASLLARRILWLLAQLFNAAASAIGGVVSHHVCRTVLSLPLDTEKWFALLCAVSCFGALSDLTSAEYQFLLRIVGLSDPPKSSAPSGPGSNGPNDDSSEMAEGP